MLFRIFLYIISLSPLFFGTNRAWSWSLYSLIIACLCLSYFVNTLRNKKGFDIAINPIKYPLALVSIPIIWALIQTSSWIPSEYFHPFWGLSNQQLINEVTPSISLSPAETGTAAMKLVSYFLVFFLSFQFSRQSDKANSIFKTTAYFGTAYAIYGLYAFWVNDNSLLGFSNDAYQNNVRSTFINRNSYATYAGLSILALLPLLMDRVKSCFIYGLENHFGRQYFIENLMTRAWLPVLMLMIILTALFLSHSRGGFLSSSLAILIFFITLLLSGKLKKGKAISIFLMTTVVISLSFWNSSDKLLDRMDQINLDNNGRINVYTILDKAIDENYWLGTGYGAFEKSFKLYRDETVRGYYIAAHNSYLEYLFELGFFQAIALFSGILFIAVKCLQGIWQRQRHWEYPAIGFAATSLVAAHALVDFSLQIPAVAYTFALLMGAAFAQSLPRHLRIKSE